MSSPTFSVIIPMYNRESTIVEALESVAAQVFRGFECFVVDDGSSDASCEIVSRYHFVTLIKQTNSGPGVARNRAAQMATGQFLAFLDSDDQWFPWTLKLYLQAIIEFERPAFITGCPASFHVTDELSAVNESATCFHSFNDYLATGEQWLWHGVSSFVIRRDVFLAAGGFANGRINGEDAELCMRLGMAPGFVHISEPAMFAYRVHSGNVTLDREKSKAGLKLLIDGEKEGRFPGGKERAHQRAAIISRHVRPFALEAAKQGDIRTAVSMYTAVLRDAFAHGRAKFILGLPLLCLLGLIRRAFK